MGAGAIVRTRSPEGGVFEDGRATGAEGAVPQPKTGMMAAIATMIDAARTCSAAFTSTIPSPEPGGPRVRVARGRFMFLRRPGT
jgi:hypothetical protein